MLKFWTFICFTVAVSAHFFSHDVRFHYPVSCDRAVVTNLIKCVIVLSPLTTNGNAFCDQYACHESKIMQAHTVKAVLWLRSQQWGLTPLCLNEFLLTSETAVILVRGHTCVHRVSLHNQCLVLTRQTPQVFNLKCTTNPININCCH